MSANVRKKKLSSNQRKALAALLENRTIAAAAEACGLNEKTLRRYLQDPFFKSELAQQESAIIDQVGRSLISGQLIALKTLFDIMTNGESESARRLAASTWMDFSLRWRELKIEARLAALEAAVYGQHE